MHPSLARPLSLAAVGTAAAALTAGIVTSAGPAGAAAVASCHGSQLRITHGFQQGAAGHSYLPLRFQNVSATACTLFGYPGMDALGPNGGVLRHARRTPGPTPERTVLLMPGQFASAFSQWLNFNPATGGSCRHSAAIAVTPPNTFKTRRMNVQVNLCGLQIHPVVKGKSGV
jgi:hypothetical protein